MVYTALAIVNTSNVISKVCAFPVDISVIDVRLPIMSKDPDSIETRLVAVAKALGWGIAKTGEVNFGKTRYSYTKSADTLRTVGPALAAEGIALALTMELAPYSTFEKVHLKVSVTYCAEGCGTLTTEGYGAGKSAAGDEKAILKAQSSAIKYAHIMAFSLAMGFDPEEDDNRAETDGARERREERGQLADMEQRGGEDLWKRTREVMREVGASDVAVKVLGDAFNQDEEIRAWISDAGWAFAAAPTWARAQMGQWLTYQGGRCDLTEEQIRAALKTAAEE